MRRIDDIKADIKRYSKEKNETLLNRAKGELFEAADDISGLWNEIPLERKQEIVLAEQAGTLVILSCKCNECMWLNKAICRASKCIKHNLKTNKRTYQTLMEPDGFCSIAEKALERDRQ